MKTWKGILACLSVAALAGALIAADEKADAKKAPAKKGGSGGVLHPEMTTEGSSFAKPMGTLAEKPAQPWSTTTVAAAVDAKPVPGNAMTVTGEIIDLSCYLQVGKHGEKHKSCGQKCLTNGQPIGLLAKDGTVYMLMDEEHDPRRDGQTELRKAATDHLAHVMEVSGTQTNVNGHKAIFVQGFVKK